LVARCTVETLTPLRADMPGLFSEHFPLAAKLLAEAVVEYADRFSWNHACGLK